MHPNYVLKFLFLLLVNGMALTGFAADPTPDVPEQTRRYLFEARNAAWRSFFEADPAAAIEKSLLLR